MMALWKRRILTFWHKENTLLFNGACLLLWLLGVVHDQRQHAGIQYLVGDSLILVLLLAALWGFFFFALLVPKPWLGKKDVFKDSLLVTIVCVGVFGVALVSLVSHGVGW